MTTLQTHIAELKAARIRARLMPFETLCFHKYGTHIPEIGTEAFKVFLQETKAKEELKQRPRKDDRSEEAMGIRKFRKHLHRIRKNYTGACLQVMA